MVSIKSLQFLPTAINEASKETTHIVSTNEVHTEASSNGTTTNAILGNMMHVALVGINNQMSSLQDSGDEVQAQERINKLAKMLKENTMSSNLCSAGVKVISCIIQRDDGQAPMRHCFPWSTDKCHYEEEPLLRHLEPPLSTYLELFKLKGYKNIQYSPSLDRQWHLYTVVDNKATIQRMFLRTLFQQQNMCSVFSLVSQGQDFELLCTHPSMSFTAASILRFASAALEELELHAHSATVRSDHSRVYLCILREQQLYDIVPISRDVELIPGQEEDTICSILKEMASKVHELVGVRMHRLAVCEWKSSFGLILLE